MRTVIYGGACSLDGFFTGPNGELDWLHFSQDVQTVIARSFAAADTILFGRKSWEAAVASGQGAATPGMTAFVFSRTLTSLPPGAATLVKDDPGTFVRALKQQPGKDILVMSGGNLARALLAAGVVDEIGMNVHPVLLGSGTPAFVDCGHRVRLDLTEARAIDGGCVLMTYRVRPS